MFFLLYNVTLIYLSSVACFLNAESCDIEIVRAIQNMIGQRKKTLPRNCLFKKKKMFVMKNTIIQVTFKKILQYCLKHLIFFNK